MYNTLKTTRCSAVGSAPALGAGCREFESRHSDQKMQEWLNAVPAFFFWKRDSNDQMRLSGGQSLADGSTAATPYDVPPAHR